MILLQVKHYENCWKPVKTSIDVLGNQQPSLSFNTKEGSQTMYVILILFIF